MKMHSYSTEGKFQLLKQPWTPDSNELPDIVVPKSLSAERQWYLYDQIRPFCRDSAKDITCPYPNIPKPGSRSGTSITSLSAEPSAVTENPSAESPPHKRVRLCGTSKQAGHNSRSCPTKN